MAKVQFKGVLVLNTVPAWTDHDDSGRTVGGEIDPQLPRVIGVTGHRDVRADAREDLAQRVRELLLNLRRTYAHTPPLLLSPLAERSAASLVEGLQALCPRFAKTTRKPRIRPATRARANFCGIADLCTA